jgi:hypothetical protein
MRFVAVAAIFAAALGVCAVAASGASGDVISGGTLTPTASASPAASTTPSPTATPDPLEAELWGDYDCSGIVDLDDALLGLEAFVFVVDAAPAGDCEPSVDLNCDEEYDGIDMLAIVRFVAGLPMSFDGCAQVGAFAFDVSNDCASLQQAQPIPENGSTYVTFDFPESEEIIGLALCLNIDHEFVGDLTVTLRHDDTDVTTTVVERAGNPANSGNCSGHGEGIFAVFGDSAAATLHEHCTDPTNSEFIGSFQPDDPFAAFHGEDVNGVWTLTVADEQSGQEGVLLGAILTYFYQQ